jgi:catechol 2,3-dioxygenase-like lactoylglutathione lyase family enzyme
MKRVPTEFRRVTMIVQRMDVALSIYRDILGMQLFYDKEIPVTGKGLPADAPAAQARLVILKCNDPFIGMLGLMQYLDPPLPEPDPRPVPNRVRPGEVVFVLVNDNVEQAYGKLKEVEGVEIVSPPHVSEFPRKGGGTMRVLGVSFFDPNGYFVDLNQVIE